MRLASVILSALVAALPAATRASAQGPPPPQPEGPAEKDVRALATGVNGFGWELYRRLGGADGNVFISPLSVAECLAMADAGARGATAAGLEKALGFPFSGERLLGAWQGLRGALKASGGKGGAVFRLADSLWPASDVKLLAGYLDSVEKAFGPSVFPVDYKGDPQGARAAVNDWTLDVTSGRITDLITSPPPPDTVLTLVNAVYFKGVWEDPFKEEQTEEGPFHAGGAGPVTADFMNRVGTYLYLEDDLGQVLELPYRGGAFAMAVLLPREGGGGLAALEKAVTGESLAARLEGSKPTRVDVGLPKFTVSWGASSLSAPLKALGAGAAFGDAADFSGMAGGGGVKISDVVHKSFIEVNEEGTKAAAATGGMMSATSMPPPPVVFKADRPFLFVIRDRATGAALFLGRLSDPSR